MSRRPVTAAQLSVLLHVRGQLLVRGLPPTARDLGELLGISGAAAQRRIEALIAKGYLRRAVGPHKTCSRTLQLVDVDGAGEAGANGGHDDDPLLGT